jgi:predicted oxidoreductase
MHTPRMLGPELSVGPLAFGCWRFTSRDVARNTALIEVALDAGCTLIDNADVYGLDWGGTGFGSCEENLGAVLEKAPHLRHRMVLATKGGIIPGVPYDSSADYLVRAAEESLRRLRVDHVDLYQIHRPDFFTHPAEIASAFADLHHRGLVSEFGVSNFSATQTVALSAHLDRPLVSVQPEFSAAHTAPLRDGVLDLCLERNLTPLAWSPLAGGRLATGEGIRHELTTVLDELAEVHRTSRVAVATAFVLHHPSRPVAIVGTQNAARLRELGSAVDVALTRAELYRIVEASEGVRLP